METDERAERLRFGNSIGVDLIRITFVPSMKSIGRIVRDTTTRQPGCAGRAATAADGWNIAPRPLHLTLETVWDRLQHLTARAGPKKIVLRPKQEQLLRLLRDRKSLTPQEIRNGIGLSKQGAMDLLKPLLEAGLIQRVGTKKSGRYLLS